MFNNIPSATDSFLPFSWSKWPNFSGLLVIPMSLFCSCSFSSVSLPISYYFLLRNLLIYLLSHFFLQYYIALLPSDRPSAHFIIPILHNYVVVTFILSYYFFKLFIVVLYSFSSLSLVGVSVNPILFSTFIFYTPILSGHWLWLTSRLFVTSYNLIDKSEGADRADTEVLIAWL